MGSRTALRTGLVTALLIAIGLMWSAPAAEAQGVSFSNAQAATNSGFAITGIAVDARGDVFVADFEDGAVKEVPAVNGSIPPNPTIKTLASGFSGPGYTGPGGVAVDANGNVFLTDPANNAVREILAVNGSIPANPVINTLGSGFSTPWGIAVDGNGNVYVADTGHGEVKKIVAVDGLIPANPAIQTLGSGFRSPLGVAVDAKGNVYVGDVGLDEVREIVAVGGSIPTNPTIKTLAFGGSAVSVAVDGSGNVYYAVGSDSVYEILAVDGSIPTNPTIMTVGGSFASSATSVTLDKRGDIFVVLDDGNIDSEVVVLQTANVDYPGVNVCPSGSGAPAPCSFTQTLTFNIAAGTTIGSVQVLTLGAPNLDFRREANDSSAAPCKAQTYANATTCTVNVTFAPLLAGARSGAVQILDGAGNVLAATNLYGIGAAPEIAFTPANQISLSGGSGVAFNFPSGVALDGSSNIFVADFGNDAVYELPVTGGYTTVKTLGGGFAFGGPAGVAVDGSGNVFVADFFKNALYEIEAAGGYSTVVPLAAGFTFNNPTDVALDGIGNLFVSDHDGAVYEVLAAGGYATVIQLASSFKFGLPSGLAVDGGGNVFVSDANNDAVYEIPVAGGYTTVNQLASGFSFNAPLGVSVDAGGNVFVADAGVTTVYEILAGGYTTVLPLGGGLGQPESLTVDALGNVYVPDAGIPHTVIPAIRVIQRSAPPALNFAATLTGATSSDSPKSVQFQNIGNQPLTGTGALSDFTDFTILAGPGTVPDCNGILGLLPGGECNVSFSFTPQSGGPLSSTLTLSDNALNGNPATQMVTLNGTGIFVPQIATVSPNYGAIAASINLTGSFGATEGSGYVQVNGAKSQIISWSNSAITIRVPYNGAVGLGSVVVTAEGQRSNAVPFTLYAGPTITNVSVTTGTPGTPVMITGTNLLDGGGNAIVTFNGTAATITSDSTTGIQVSVPISATSGQLRVTVNGVALQALANFVVVPSLPNITGISPNYGAIAASINLTGNFGATEGNGYVQVNGAKSQVVLWSNNTITVRAPYNGTLGLGTVVVTAVGLRSNAVPYTLYAGPTISNVSVTTGTPGTPVMITGTNLLDGGGKASVTFNGTPATITSDTATSIQVTVPTGATSGQLRVTVNGVSLEALANFVVVPSLPNVTGISPGYGAIAASIYLTGNFGASQGDGYVQVNGAKSQVVLWSNNAITVRAPYNGTLGLGTVVVTAVGLRSNAVPYTLYAGPTITNVSVTTGAAGTPVTITGTNLLDGGGKASATFNGTPATITSDTATSIQVAVPSGATSGQLRVTVNGVALIAVANFVVTK